MKHTDSNQVFQKDLSRGRKLENYILEICRQKYPCATLIEGKFKGYDLFVPETGKKLEIKGDFRSQETGNIVIELMMYDKPSALLSTEADVWVFCTGKELLWITPIKIIECIMVNNIPSRRLTGRGDSVSKIACLVPFEVFRQYSHKIEEVSPDFLDYYLTN